MVPPALWLYRALVAATLPFLAPWLAFRARSRGTHRPPLLPRLGRRLPPAPRRGVWVQAVSVGEVAVARPLMAELRRRQPGLPLILSATTATGLQVASGAQVADAVLPFPLDLPHAISRYLDTVEPRLVVLVETELWPELLYACGRRGIPVALVNARVSDASFRGYEPIRAILRPLLRPVTRVLAQSELDARRLATMGIAPERIEVVGNIKFDAAPPGAEPRVIGELRRLAGTRPVLVAGSTMSGEDDNVLDAILALPTGRRPFVILAPRHPERATEALAAATSRGLAALRRTHLDGAPAPCDVVVLDTIGELAALYAMATVAFVGGSLGPTGGHNPIEPARHGVPVLTGPNVRNFAAVYDSFFQSGAARVVRDHTELAAAIAAFLADPDLARAAGEAGRELLARNAGATARTVDALERLLA
jgi:3-deoxy-D-manno-octulosonic-acid transferase